MSNEVKEFNSSKSVQVKIDGKLHTFKSPSLEKIESLGDMNLSDDANLKEKISSSIKMLIALGMDEQDAKSLEVNVATGLYNYLREETDLLESSEKKKD